MKATSFEEDTQFNFTVEAEFPVLVAFMSQYEPGVPGCENLDGNMLDVSGAPACEFAMLSRCVGPGTYYVVVQPFGEYDYGYEIPCDGNNDYTATLECEPCTYTDGACCFDDAYCQIMTPYDCYSFGGEYQGDDIPCDPNPCLTGACWFEAEGDDAIACAETTPADCEARGGVFRGPGVPCDLSPPEP
jgi:hypothetical protein